MILMKLKLKYRVYRTFNSGKYRPRTGNSHAGSNHPSPIRPRKRAYGPF